MRYGEQSEQAKAVCQRLHVLGYLAELIRRTRYPCTGALRRFQTDVGLGTRLNADTDTLQALSLAVRAHPTADA